MSQPTKENISSKRNFRRTQGPQNNTSPSNDKKNPRRKQKRNGTGLKSSSTEDDSGEENELCVICARKLLYASLTPCHHKTCHTCAFRQRALYEKRTCLICRTENEEVTFTEHIDSDISDLQNFYEKSEKYGINFTSEEVASATLNSLKFFCPLSEDEQAIDFGSFKKYNEHLKTEHNKMICLICATHKHAFPSELEIFTQNQLRNHQSRGNSEGFKGHPMCAFCSGKRFYSDDELYVHMRNQHEKCHICDKINPSSPQYFKDYDQLFSHFRHSHYVCTVQSCLDNKFVVFKDELELQAHILQEHGNILKGKPKFFQSELSTFISAPSRVVRERDDYDLPSMSSLPGSASGSRTNVRSASSPEESRLRLVERAKYYLENSKEDFDKFASYNEDYARGYLNAEKLLELYKSLFTKPNADVYLLVHNLAETFPKNSSKYNNLNAIYEQREQTLARQTSLPSLSSDTSLSMSIARGHWGGTNDPGSGGAALGVRNIKNLPTLKTPTASYDPFATTIKKQTLKSVRGTKKTTSQPIVYRASNNAVAFSPTYLESKKNSSSSSSLNNSKDKLKSLNLPQLPPPKPKVQIPGLNRPQVADPKRWGKKSNTESVSVHDDLRELNISSGGNKKKGKQKQLLFHIGV
ncbi:YDR266C [Saccharomyces arboricola H-6]|uniref:RING-type E3 ubiquitin transferase n=1 Tax=Saccharomyces arboricola (strain H-6 / AS 2.3317 / CBS 10644) TaxID=1160507 RepID=J8PJG9_SACAR|nr:YDR266C [Saccharomyces arboricola H-6]